MWLPWFSLFIVIPYFRRQLFVHLQVLLEIGAHIRLDSIVVGACDDSQSHSVGAIEDEGVEGANPGGR